VRRIRLTVAYDGARYVGWQTQPNGTSIEEVLNQALSKLLKENITVIGASRTDSGVHADGNIAVFDTESRIPGDKFKFALNEFLPADVVVQDSCEVALNYHPRKLNSVKTYEYRILNRRLPLPKERDYAYFYYYPLDTGKMRRAAEVILGEHDFKSFCSIRTQIEDTVRRIYSVSLEKEGDMIVFRISGNGFLYNMVRIIVGTLVKIGNGMIPEESMRDILEARDRSKAGPRAPAMGLTLKSIEEEKALSEVIDEDNTHWSYMLYQGRIAAEKAGFLIIRACEEWAYDAMLLRLTKQLSRNGADRIFVKDLTGRLYDGRKAAYFTYRLCTDRETAGRTGAGRWFRTGDPRRSFAGIIEEDEE